MNQPGTAGRLRGMVEALCTADTAGRAPGTPQGLAARRLVTTWFEEAGLTPAGSESYLQMIPGIGGANIVGSIAGSGARSDRFVVIGAHYDHLGIDDVDTFWGADDNASGVAVMVEVAARLVESAAELDRTVLFCSFDAKPLSEA